jgi:hypothetical protein
MPAKARIVMPLAKWCDFGQIRAIGDRLKTSQRKGGG